MGQDWQVVEDRLKEQAEEVCRHLLPKGHREGAEWVCGSAEGEEGRSLKINLAGKVGVWCDFASDKKGKTLIGLWCTVRGRPFKECIVEAKRFAGVRDDFEERIKAPRQISGQAPPPRDDSTWQSVAKVWPRCEPLQEGGVVWEYLVNQRRIAPETLAWYDVREMLSFGRPTIVYPYYSPQEENQAEEVRRVLADAQVLPSWIKFELVHRPEGKKKEWTTTGPEKCLWGLQAARADAFRDARHVIITEGEKDALSWASFACHRWSILPVSVPFGAKHRGQIKGQPTPNREWLDRCWEWLQGFETVFVAMDSDQEGRLAAADIIAEIGPRRCRLVELPEKPK